MIFLLNLCFNKGLIDYPNSQFCLSTNKRANIFDFTIQFCLRMEWVLLFMMLVIYYCVSVLVCALLFWLYAKNIFAVTK